MSLTAIERKIAELEKEMRAAAEHEDFERAASLRNQIEAMRATGVRKPPPGEMGMGTNQPVIERRKGWKPPRKPDPMTTNVKRGR